MTVWHHIDRDRVADLSCAIGTLLADADANNAERFAALSACFSIMLEDQPAEIRAEICRLFFDAVRAYTEAGQ